MRCWLLGLLLVVALSGGALIAGAAPAALGAEVPAGASGAALGVADTATTLLRNTRADVTRGERSTVNARRSSSSRISLRLAAEVPAKRGPKPFGTGPHNLKTSEVADSITDGRIVAGGQTGLPERFIPTPAGLRSGRRPDILVERFDGSQYGVNIGRASSRSGAPASERPRRSTISKGRASRCISSPTAEVERSMPNVQIQFHADPDEAVALGLGWANRYGLTVVLEHFFPDYRTTVAHEAVTDLRRLGRVDRLALCSTKPDLAAATPHEFTKRNSNCLYLSIGRREDGAVRESALGGTTDDPETLRTWRSVVREAKSTMHSGATVRDPATGAVQRMPRHLHTVGAHQLAAEQVRMLAAAGWTEFEFADC